MVLNAAYLVADERAGEFAAAVADLTARHQFVQLTLTGPWPAYSFVGESDGPGSAMMGPAYEPASQGERIALVDLLDRVLAGGVVIVGDITLSIAEVDLVRVSLRALVTSISGLMEAMDDSQEYS